MFFNILSSLYIYNIIHLNNHRILFFQHHKLCYKWKLVLLLIKIYKTIDVLYKTTLYVNLFPKTFFFFFPFLAWLKKSCYKYLQHFLLLDEHSYKLKKGILWTDHIKHKTMSEAPSCAIFVLLKYSTENAHQTLVILIHSVHTYIPIFSK